MKRHPLERFGWTEEDVGYVYSFPSGEAIDWMEKQLIKLFGKEIKPWDDEYKEWIEKTREYCVAANLIFGDGKLLPWMEELLKERPHIMDIVRQAKEEAGQDHQGE